MSQEDPQVRIRRAMLSIYQHSLWRALEQRGAPAIMLPPSVRPLPLEKAFRRIEELAPERLREAVWTLVRGLPPPLVSESEDHADERYPAPVQEIFARHGIDVAEFDRTRRTYRAGAQLFAAALVAYAQGRLVDYRYLCRCFDRSSQTEDVALVSALQFSDAAAATGSLGGGTLFDYLVSLPKDAAHGLLQLEREVGVSIGTFVAEFADAVAFMKFWDAPSEDGGIAVYPACTVAVQRASTLTTQVTVTALVRTGDFGLIEAAVDPRNWHVCSDVFSVTRFVEDPYTLKPVPPTARAEPLADGVPRLFEERVRLTWGVADEQIGSFQNVLNVVYPAAPDGDELPAPNGPGRVHMKFWLNRSVKSRVLWDERAGGILIDGGYIKVRPVAAGVWRVVSRKVIRFSDRTPYSSGGDLFDFGQTMNYLAPATLSWWIESEMYSGGRPEFRAALRNRIPQEVTDGR